MVLVFQSRDSFSVESQSTEQEVDIELQHESIFKEMNSSNRGSLIRDTKLSLANKATTLNPNAAEFVPFSLKSSVSQFGSSANDLDSSTKFPSGSIRMAALDRSESHDEAPHLWRHELPDDITPDFSIPNEDESQDLEGLPFANLVLHDCSEASRLSESSGVGYEFVEHQEPSVQHFNSASFSEKMRYASGFPGKDLNSAGYLNFPVKPLDKQIFSTDHLLGKGKDTHPYHRNLRHMIREPATVENIDINPLEFLASHFPGLAAESLAEVYYANGCDLNLTVDMLTRLELQVDSGFSQNMNSKTMSASNLSELDLPALTVCESHNGTSDYSRDDNAHSRITHHSSNKDNVRLFERGASFPSRSGIDFASAFRKLAYQDSGIWKYDKNGSAGSIIGSSRSFRASSNSYSSMSGKGVYTDKMQTCGSARAFPIWFETGEAVANMYSELREEARGHARLRNVYFEQARQAYLVGNKALAKELSIKGQLQNMHMKAVHGKAQESIYRQRNPVTPEVQGNGRGHVQVIDLQGLHVSEAIHILKHELSVLRRTAWAAGQRLLVYICVGTGHHTKSSRTPTRLPVAVQRYLLEEEGLEYSETQPGMLRVVIY